MPLSPGDNIGRYRVLGPLGAGGMGVVYAAFDETLGRRVAVKLLPVEFTADQDRRHRFEREARVTGQLNHPHIVPIYDAVLDGDRPFLVSELVDGAPLSARISQGPLPLGETLRIGRQLAQALVAAHALGVVHRDLKPDNILLTRSGDAKVLDFGLAKVSERPVAEVETRLSGTAPGLAMGTVGYMAPEQIAGRPVDARADIFALGVVLHEALTGRLPFRRGTAVDTLHATLHDAAPELPDDVPIVTRQLIARCLEKDPEARFQTAQDLEFALSMPASTPEASSVKTRGGKLGVLAAGAAALAMLLVLVLWTRARTPADPSGSQTIRVIAVLPLEELSGQSDQAFLADGLTEALISDLSQVRALRVIARASVMRYKKTTRSPREIARELGVAGLVAGTVVRVNDRVRVTANLIHGDTEQHLWGEKYDRDFRDVLVLQSELARTIADRLALQLTPGERAALTPRPVDPRSHELYLKGRYFWNKRDPESLKLAQAAFTEAVRIDATSVTSWAGLADTYFYQGYAFGRMPPTEAMPQARHAAERALQLDPESAGGHTTNGLVSLFFDWNREAAETSLTRALRADPTYVLAHRGLAALELSRRRPQAAVAHARDAVRLDPASVAEHYFLALSLYATGDLEDSERACKAVLELAPGHGGAVSLLGHVQRRRGEAKRAVELYQEAARLQGTPEAQIAERAAAFSGGDLTAYHAAELRHLVAGWDGWHFTGLLIAVKQAETGQREAAYHWLRRLRDQRSAGLILANGNEAFEAYRGDPEYRELLGPAFTDDPPTSLAPR
jgi:serine/threonine protein kinase/tetratricopeptide (TPR) repeat protein